MDKPLSYTKGEHTFVHSQKAQETCLLNMDLPMWKEKATGSLLNPHAQAGNGSPGFSHELPLSPETAVCCCPGR